MTDIYDGLIFFSHSADDLLAPRFRQARSGLRSRGRVALTTSDGGPSVMAWYPSLDPILEIDILLERVGVATNVVVAPTGRHLASAWQQSDGTRFWAQIHEVASGSVIPLLGVEVADLQIGVSGPFPVFTSLNIFSFSPDGSMISVVGKGRDHVFEMGGSVVMRGYDDAVTWDHSWSADSLLLLTVHNREMRLWAVVFKPFSPSMPDADLPDVAAEMLTRSFSTAECAAYDLDPCPTLDDIRRR